MTDLDRFIALYQGLGIECKPDRSEEGTTIKLVVEPMFHGGEVVTTHPSFGGYSGFYTLIKFDAQGKYLGQEFLE